MKFYVKFANQFNKAMKKKIIINLNLSFSLRLVIIMLRNGGKSAENIKIPAYSLTIQIIKFIKF